MIKIDYNTYRSIKGFNRRVRFLILHYTAVNFADSITSLTGPSVSVHYLVPDSNDLSYQQAGYNKIRVFNLVDEMDRAWHAGASAWQKRNNLNDSSIGIEIVNLATEDECGFNFPPYPQEQIDAVAELCLNILPRYPDISPTNVLAHSDIAVGRKSDPGAAFPWYELSLRGIGAWYDECTKACFELQFQKELPNNQQIIQQLDKYGYDTTYSHTPEGYKQLIRAVQLHFRPTDYSGTLDIETAAIIYSLVKKYRSS